MVGVSEMPPPSVEEELLISILPIVKDIAEEQEHQVAPEQHLAKE